VDQAISTQAYEQNGSLIMGNESSVNWNDRRPITELFPMTSNFQSPNNDTNLAADLLNYAASEINAMLADGSQGAITWDISDFNNASAYDGAPEMATTLIPQLGESVAQMGFGSNPNIAPYYSPTAAGSLVDEYFAMFHDAGLKTGVTLRMTQIDPQEQNGIATQTPSNDPVSLLIGRIEYAEQNWGCSMFYIDSIDSNAQAAAVIAAVHDAVPNVLLIPEHVTDAEFADAAGYYQEASTATPLVRTPGVSDVTTPAVQIAYPDGFIITRSDMSNPAFTSADVPTIEASLQMGDTFFIQGAGPVLSAQQTLALNNSSAMVSVSNNVALSVSLVTAPDGATYNQFSSNGNIIYSQPGTASQQMTTTNSGSGSTHGTLSSTTLSATFAGTTNALLIDTGSSDPNASGFLLQEDGPLSNDNAFLMA
jgi:hypothetical protein